MKLILDGAQEALHKMADNVFDALVTDPPAGISFMGKTWDHNHGGRAGWVKAFSAIFIECLRVLKPGAHGLVWALPRTSHWTAVALEDAGFEIRDVVTHHYGTGFPKSLDVGKRLPEWQGWGTALKPASEHWILVRKPLSEKTVVANVLRWGTGALNIDGTRISGIKGTPASPRRAAQNAAYGDLSKDPGTGSGWDANVGRWPANLVLSGDADSMLDVQAKGVSRFFYVIKPSRAERNLGGANNNHPTVKPIALMVYLCRLVIPPGGIVLDPFMGSGSTGVAALAEGFGFVGIEKDPGYMAIARKRMRHSNKVIKWRGNRIHAS